MTRLALAVLLSAIFCFPCYASSALPASSSNALIKGYDIPDLPKGDSYASYAIIKNTVSYSMNKDYADYLLFAFYSPPVVTYGGYGLQLLKLEAELGTPLFQRCKNNLRLTEAGKVYVDYGRQILHLKKDAYDILNDFADNKVGSLSIGLTPERGINMLMNVYPEFHNRFPHITIEPQEIGVRRQQSLISKGYLDLGFVTLNDADKTGDEYIHIYYEDILLAVPRRHPLARNANPPGAPFAVADLRDFKDEYFVLMFKNSTMHSVIDPLFEESGFKPKLLFETASNQTMCNMVKNNMACSLLTYNYAQEQEDVAYFYLPQRPRWELCATYKKEHYLTQAARTFIALAIDHYRNTALKIGQPIL